MEKNINLKIDWATHDATVYACKNWHYSRSVPVPPLVKIGVWENDKYIGVVLFSRGASSNLLKPYGLEMNQGCELTRVALTEHVTPVSKIVSIAIKFLKKKSPTLRLIVSFADMNQGHYGIIYQAGNWLYFGKTNSMNEYYYKGKKIHSRQLSEKGFNTQQGNIRKTIKPSQCEKVKAKPKHRYLMPLDKAMRQKLTPLSKQYPKRATKASTVTNGNAAEHSRPARSISGDCNG